MCRYSTACATAANVSVDNIEIKSVSAATPAAAVAVPAAVGQGRAAEIKSSLSPLVRTTTTTTNNTNNIAMLIEPPILGQAGGRSPA